MCSYNYIGDCASAIITVLINGKCGEAYNTANPDVRQLRHQINSSSQEKVLQYINYLIFEHTENVYFSKKIEEEIKNNKMIEKLSQEANGLPRFGHLSADNMFGIGYEAVKPEDIPNFLDESWAIKEEESTDAFGRRRSQG